MAKTIILIGKTGSGKSTLSNVLVDRDNDFREIFRESSGSVSETRSIQSEKFEDNDINYLVIDTPGIGDTKLAEHEVLDIIAGAVYLSRDGINQTFFVINGKFSQYEAIIYNLLKKTIFDDDISNYATVVRTNFLNFRTKKECEKDINKMLGENSELVEIINSCQGKIIHVDNPPLNSDYNKNMRIKSKERLLKHLRDNCQNIYKPQNLEELTGRISNDMKKKEELTGVSNNNSSTQLLEDKTVATGSTSQPTNVFRKRTISSSKGNKSTNRENYELVDLQIQEELQTQVEIPPK